MATVIGTSRCSACDGGAEVREGKGGTLFIQCLGEDCRSGTMVKRPNAVAALRARLAGQGKPAAGAAGAAAADSPAGAAKGDFAKFVDGGE